MAGLYETDFVAWADEQARLLRAGRVEVLDLANLAEELAEMGDSKRDAIASHLTTVIEHLLKLQFCPDPYPRRSWMVTVRTHRTHLKRKLSRSPSLAGFPAQILTECYEDARAIAAIGIGVPEEALPAECPYSVEQALAAEFLPEMASVARL